MNKKKSKKLRKNKKLSKSKNYSEPFGSGSGGSGGGIPVYQQYPAAIRDANILNGLKVADTAGAINLIKEDLNKNMALFDKKINSRFNDNGLIDKVREDINLIKEISDNRNNRIFDIENKLGNVENEQKFQDFGNRAKNVISNMNSDMFDINNRLIDLSNKQNMISKTKSTNIK